MRERRPTTYGTCSGCLGRVAITMDGTLRNHPDPETRRGHCSSGHKPPLVAGDIEQQKADALNAALAARDRGVSIARTILDVARRHFDDHCQKADDTYRAQVQKIERTFAELATKLKEQANA